MSTKQTRSRKRKHESARAAVKEAEDHVETLKADLASAMSKLKAADMHLSSLACHEVVCRDQEQLGLPDQEQLGFPAQTSKSADQHISQFECPVCLRPYCAEEPHVPVVLCCGQSTHTFCRSCLFATVLCSESHDGGYKCPLCRKSHDIDIAELPKNDAVLSACQNVNVRFNEDLPDTILVKIRSHTDLSVVLCATRVYMYDKRVVEAVCDAVFRMVTSEEWDRQNFDRAESVLQELTPVVSKHPGDMNVVATISGIYLLFLNWYGEETACDQTSKLFNGQAKLLCALTDAFMMQHDHVCMASLTACFCQIFLRLMELGFSVADLQAAKFMAPAALAIMDLDDTATSAADCVGSFALLVVSLCPRLSAEKMVERGALKAIVAGMALFSKAISSVLVAVKHKETQRSCLRALNAIVAHQGALKTMAIEPAARSTVSACLEVWNDREIQRLGARFLRAVDGATASMKTAEPQRVTRQQCGRQIDENAGHT